MCFPLGFVLKMRPNCRMQFGKLVFAKNFIHSQFLENTCLKTITDKTSKTYVFSVCRFCSFEGANENVWHVLDVQPNSPASLAGLRSDTDYIIGADSILHEVNIEMVKHCTSSKRKEEK